MKGSLAAVAAFVGLGLEGQAAGGGLKIGYIDLPYLFLKSEIGKEYSEKFKAEYAKREKELQPKESELKARMQRFEQQRAMMSPKSLKETQESLQEQMKALQADFQEMRMALMQKEEAYTKEVMSVIFEVVKEVATAEHYDYVWEKRSLLFGGDDLTPQVMKALNERHKKNKKK